MANVRCPMCSKLNPPDAVVCAYCGARLKPAGIASSPSNQSGDDEPDWLRSLRSDDGDDKPVSQPENTPADSELGPDVPDWLSRIRDRARTETGDEDMDEPDWMKGLQDEASSGKDAFFSAVDEPSSGTGETPSTSDEVGDWMERLPGSGSTANPPAAGQSDVPDWLQSGSESAPAGGDEDWMSKLSAWQTPAGEDAEEKPAAPVEDFGWLSDAAPQDEQPDQAAEPGFGLTSFLSNLEDSSGKENTLPAAEEPALPDWSPSPDQKSDQPEESTPGFGMTGFLSGLEQSSAEQEETGSSEFDWALADEPGKDKDTGGLSLAGFLTGLEGPGEPEGTQLPQEKTGFPEWDQGTDAAAGAPVDGLPDWLSSESAPLEPDAQQAGEAGLPGWLDDSDRAAPIFSTQGEELPSWLNPEDLENAQAQPPQQPEEAAAGMDVPDWLTGFNEPASTDQPPAEEPTLAGETPGSIELPTWLEDSQQEPQAAAPEEVPAAGAEDLPDWFASFDQTDLEQTQPKRVTQQPPSESAEEVPDWLREFNEQPQDAPAEAVMPLIGDEEAPVVPAFEAEQPFTVDLPEWLSEDDAVKPAELGESTAEPAGEALAQAELPEWVKEMRPIESMIPEEAQMTEMDQRVERAGPLTGMRGVLPAEEMAARWSKPPIYSVKLHVTEKQRSQASLLESILTQESQPLLIPPERSHAPGLMLRALIALIMLAVLIVPFVPVLHIEPLGVPVLYPAEMLQMFDQIDQSLQSNAPVLLAVDYQPGLSGEMHMAAAAVVDHLMAKNARIVIVSTVPTGPALAQQLVADTQAAYQERTQQAFDLTRNVVNLGYLPGGTISLLEFAQQPALAAPTNLAGQNAWNNTFLADVSGLAGFSQIVVITDSGETGRAWVEQVQPWIGGKPLFMVTSAQAAPLMSPYVESNQIAGMVSGLLGGAMYARLAGQNDSPAITYLAAYQIGIVLAFVLVLVGGLITGVTSLLKRGGRQEE